MSDARGHGERSSGADDMESLLFDSVEPGAQAPARSPPPAPAPPPARPPIAEFGEEAYREGYPDIDAAISNGRLASAADHFRHHGRNEERLTSASYLRALCGSDAEFPARGAVPFNVDAAILSQGGTMFVVGWTDDRANRLRSVSILQGHSGTNTRGIGRCRRGDVEALLQAPAGFSFGFWLVVKLEGTDVHGRSFVIRARMADGSFEQREIQASVTSDFELRETILSHFASLEYHGNRDIEAFTNLESGAGLALTALNRSTSAAITSMAHAERHGPRRTRFRASLVICLFGKIEFFFLQNALFSRAANLEEYEFIYVSNSPELAEALQKEARIASRIYGLSVTLVTLPGNAGFSAANNAAARFARSDRIMFVNPDVFPRDANWAGAHAGLLEARPREQTKLFGASLFYDDGSLMHGGMYFEVDQGLSVRESGITSHGMVRVEHYGKGAPEWSGRHTAPRAVPAVTGAFISADREWFEALGGFTEDYLFGHYEDADLCLKSLRQGVPAWLHDLRFWHLEGKGSVRRPPHEGGSLVNRWLFTRRWRQVIEASLAGRSPSHPLLSQASPQPLALPAVEATSPPRDPRPAPPAHATPTQPVPAPDPPNQAGPARLPTRRPTLLAGNTRRG